METPASQQRGIWMGSTRSQGLSYLLFEFPGGQQRERKWASITKKEIEPLSLKHLYQDVLAAKAL